jgi:predicted nucleic acid-binding Zn ribbon protein
MRDEPFRECPKELCRLSKWGHGKVKRLLGTGAGLIFKGSGFYTTDYRSQSYKEAAKKESAPKAAEGGEKSAASKDTAKASSPSQTKTSEKRSAKDSGG